jgi:hypothetical protein
MPLKKAAPVKMWAIVVKAQRSEWIHWLTLDKTRTGAWAKYFDQWTHKHHPEQERKAGKIRAEKVIVSLP